MLEVRANFGAPFSLTARLQGALACSVPSAELSFLLA